jgi:hypothetical protein
VGTIWYRWHGCPIVDEHQLTVLEALRSTSRQVRKPTAVWVQICIFTNGTTYTEVKQLIANARQHVASNATIYITEQPLYDTENSCQLAGPGGPRYTDKLAQQASADTELNVKYPGHFHKMGTTQIPTDRGLWDNNRLISGADVVCNAHTVLGSPNTRKK